MNAITALALTDDFVYGTKSEFLSTQLRKVHSSAFVDECNTFKAVGELLCTPAD